MFKLSIITFSLSLLIAPICAFPQTPFAWTVKAAMPMPVSNNAVSGAKIGSNYFTYSFGGIGSGRDYRAITNKCFAYNVQSDKWDTIPDLPSNEPLIALAATNIKDTIYICGGYSVDSLGGEKTNANMFRFVPAINSFISPGPNVPVPVDDQVQFAWRDSLLYLVTGWSNTANVADVQIYNPVTSSWIAGTPVIQNNRYRSFGASGIAIGDTIYYLGGAAMGSVFNIQKILRRGIIDPLDPTRITWSSPQPNTLHTGYRMASLTESNLPIWIGGSSTTYNYNGIAYNGSGAVTPEDRSLVYFPKTDELRSYSNNNHPVMDLRGIANIGSGKYLICGGMEAGPIVTNKTWEVRYNPLYLGLELQKYSIQISSFAKRFVIRSGQANIHRIQIFDLQGRLVKSLNLSGRKVEIDMQDCEQGIYQALIELRGGPLIAKRLINASAD